MQYILLVLVICIKIISHVRFDTLISFEDCFQCLAFILKIMTTCLTRLLCVIIKRLSDHLLTLLVHECISEQAEAT